MRLRPIHRTPRITNMLLNGPGAETLQDRGSLMRGAVTINPHYNPNTIARCQEYLRWYATAWEARKIIDIPVDDALRKKVTILGLDKEDTLRLENACAKYNLDAQIRRALIQERLLGGCVIFPILMRDVTEKTSDPLSMRTIQKNDHLALNVMDITRTTRANFDNDPFSPTFDKAQAYIVNGATVHASRLCILDGAPLFGPSGNAFIEMRGITRFLGQAPGGLNATGDGDRENYYDMVASYQRLRVMPVHLRLMEWIGASVWGWKEWAARSGDVAVEYLPLKTMSEREEAEIKEIRAKMVQGLYGANLIRREAAVAELAALGVIGEGVLEDVWPDGELSMKDMPRLENSADFKEEEHPRDADGKFTSAGGSGGAKKTRPDAGKLETASGPELAKKQAKDIESVIREGKAMTSEERAIRAKELNTKMREGMKKIPNFRESDEDRNMRIFLASGEEYLRDYSQYVQKIKELEAARVRVQALDSKDRAKPLEDERIRNEIQALDKAFVDKYSFEKTFSSKFQQEQKQIADGWRKKLTTPEASATMRRHMDAINSCTDDSVREKLWLAMYKDIALIAGMPETEVKIAIPGKDMGGEASRNIIIMSPRVARRTQEGFNFDDCLEAFFHEQAHALQFRTRAPWNQDEDRIQRNIRAPYWPRDAFDLPYRQQPAEQHAYFMGGQAKGLTGIWTSK